MLKGLFGRARTPLAVPDALWRATLAGLPFVARLSADEQARLHALAGEFLADKQMSGAAGLELTAEIQVNIAAQANEEDTLFGSITNTDVADALRAAGHDVDKRRVEMEDHIKQLGNYDVTVRYYGGVTATVKVWVVRA